MYTYFLLWNDPSRWFDIYTSFEVGLNCWSTRVGPFFPFTLTYRFWYNLILFFWLSHWMMKRFPNFRFITHTIIIHQESIVNFYIPWCTISRRAGKLVLNTQSFFEFRFLTHAPVRPPSSVDHFVQSVCVLRGGFFPVATLTAVERTRVFLVVCHFIPRSRFFSTSGFPIKKKTADVCDLVALIFWLIKKLVFFSGELAIFFDFISQFFNCRGCAECNRGRNPVGIDTSKREWRKSGRKEKWDSKKEEVVRRGEYRERAKISLFDKINSIRHPATDFIFIFPSSSFLYLSPF